MKPDLNENPPFSGWHQTVRLKILTVYAYTQKQQIELNVLKACGIFCVIILLVFKWCKSLGYPCEIIHSSRRWIISAESLWQREQLARYDKNIQGFKWGFFLCCCCCCLLFPTDQWVIKSSFVKPCHTVFAFFVYFLWLNPGFIQSVI